jgi:hypothetical protein
MNRAEELVEDSLVILAKVGSRSDPPTGLTRLRSMRHCPRGPAVTKPVRIGNNSATDPPAVRPIAR